MDGIDSLIIDDIDRTQLYKSGTNMFKELDLLEIDFQNNGMDISGKTKERKNKNNNGG
jgi:hypothetical protein